MEEEKSEKVAEVQQHPEATTAADENVASPSQQQQSQAVDESNQSNANVSPKSNKSANITSNSNQQQNNNKKNNNRRRKRSFRVRKNSGNFKFNPKRNKNRYDDQARRRHQIFYTDSQRLVPYNTNEFLMEDHYPKLSPNFNYQPYTHESFSSSDCGMSGSLDEDEFLTKEFRMDYENLRSEQLHDMSKDQLIEEYVKLENQTEMTMKQKENEILALNNKIKGRFMTTRIGLNLYVKFISPLFLYTELTRRLATKNGDGSKAESEDSESDSSSSSSSSSSCSSESECEMENNANDEYAAVITEPQPVSC
jgi:hypothetical protein